jgi:hydrogenase expression/formation protein HypE
LNTTAVGTVEHALPLAPLAVRPGDVILVTGDIGRHGMAIMSVREGLEFESEIESDAAPLADLVLGLLAAGITPSCLRDPTRGGLGAVLTEIAFDAGITLRVAEAAVPVRQDVQAACEILGLDPLFVACEGRMVLFVPPGQADEALGLLRRHPAGCGAAKIGEVLPGSGAQVLLESRIGVLRRLQLPSGEQLPRIC